MSHFITESSDGERCSMCYAPATHKVGEEIMHDDPNPNRHNLTAYVCCRHFTRLLGWHTGCFFERPSRRARMDGEKP